MTDTTGSGSNQAFVRTENIPQAPPPLSTRGAIGWTRENLFSSPLNVVLTIGALYVLYLFLPPLIQWAFIDAIWTGTSNADCKGGEGACWAIIPARFGQFIYGRYPDAERWRANLVFIMFCINVAPILSDRLPGRTFAALFIVSGCKQ